MHLGANRTRMVADVGQWTTTVVIVISIALSSLNSRQTDFIVQIERRRFASVLTNHSFEYSILSFRGRHPVLSRSWPCSVEDVVTNQQPIPLHLIIDACWVWRQLLMISRYVLIGSEYLIQVMICTNSVSRLAKRSIFASNCDVLIHYARWCYGLGWWSNCLARNPARFISFPALL